MDDAADDRDATDDRDAADDRGATVDATRDAGVQVDKDAAAVCRALATGRGSTPPDGVCPADAGMPIFRKYACLPAPESGTCEDAYDEECVLNTYACGISQHATGIGCGPLVDSTGQCCYVTWGGCLID
jgi:hypothetical protein